MRRGDVRGWQGQQGVSSGGDTCGSSAAGSAFSARWSFEGAGFFSANSSAKAAVVNLTQFLSREWATKGVRVNSITPGFFPAEQNRSLLFLPDGSPSPRTQAIWGHTPMKRFGESHELIGACVFLASHAASSFVTVTDIRVDGGYLSQTI